jgi:hypothetical protein
MSLLGLGDGHVRTPVVVRELVSASRSGEVYAVRRRFVGRGGLDYPIFTVACATYEDSAEINVR